MPYAEALSTRFDWEQLNQPALYIVAISSLITYAVLVSSWNRLFGRSESKESAEVMGEQCNARVSFNQEQVVSGCNAATSSNVNLRSTSTTFTDDRQRAEAYCEILVKELGKTYVEHQSFEKRIKELEKENELLSQRVRQISDENEILIEAKKQADVRHQQLEASLADISREKEQLTKKLYYSFGQSRKQTPQKYPRCVSSPDFEINKENIEEPDIGQYLPHQDVDDVHDYFITRKASQVVFDEIGAVVTNDSEVFSLE
ncbi:4427_t:CDS:1 [Paraglomus occultum]|uniref:4427_t:CDS:1 n=1 Tax=Paraglomus occultum TaxID=144539 RepID=A0A9N9C7T6_9GLOM|nr:4427_t:CDS:1 [Paraglomus occultum]